MSRGDAARFARRALAAPSRRLAGLRAARSLRRAGVVCGEGVRLCGTPVVALADGSSVVLGARVVLCSSSTCTALGVDHPVVVRTLAPGARIEIGDDVGMSGGSICSAVSVTIGAGTLIGANVTIVDTDFHPVDARHRRHAPLPDRRPEHRVAIGPDVFIGTGAIILKGSTIGEGSVIGAGSTVSGRIPEGVVAAGNPCRVLRPVNR